MIDEALARRLVAFQFPQWRDLPVRSVAISGWDNRTFHLGEQMLLRFPSAKQYAGQVEKEQRWLPRLAPLLPLQIPEPLAIGRPEIDNPEEAYPYNWSIYRWLPGESAATANIADLCDFATSLAQFLIALQRIDPTDGPAAGAHSFYRGGALSIYDVQMRQAFAALKSKLDIAAATKVWEAALASRWQHPPVWVHGDLSRGNLLVQKGRLSGVIDFGQLNVGDPACDLAIAWTLFTGKSREFFRSQLPLDAGTWARARGWTLWKALIVAAGLVESNASEAAECLRIAQEVLADQL